MCPGRAVEKQSEARSKMLVPDKGRPEEMASTGVSQAHNLARKISIARNRGATSGEAQSDSHTSILVTHQSWIERKLSKLSQPETADNWVAPETSRKLLARLPLPHDDMLSGAARAALHVRLAVLQRTERLRRKLDAEQIDSIITDEHAPTLLFASLLPRQIPKVTRTHPNPTREFDHAEALLRAHAQLLERYVQMLGTASQESQEESTRPWESTELGSLHQLLSASREARAAAAHMVPFGEEAEQQDKDHLSAPAASGAAAAVASCLAESRAARAFAETSLRGPTES